MTNSHLPPGCTQEQIDRELGDDDATTDSRACICAVCGVDRSYHRGKAHSFEEDWSIR